jgi:hypothetical protein
MRFEAWRDIAWAALAAWMGQGHGAEDGDCRVVRSNAGVRKVGAGDFEHKNAGTRDGVVGMSMGVDFCIVIGGVQEESIGLVDAKVV